MKKCKSTTHYVCPERQKYLTPTDLGCCCLGHNCKRLVSGAVQKAFNEAQVSSLGRKTMQKSAKVDKTGQAVEKCVNCERWSVCSCECHCDWPECWTKARWKHCTHGCQHCKPQSAAHSEAPQPKASETATKTFRKIATHAYDMSMMALKASRNENEKERDKLMNGIIDLAEKIEELYTAEWH